MKLLYISQNQQSLSLESAIMVTCKIRNTNFILNRNPGQSADVRKRRINQSNAIIQENWMSSQNLSTLPRVMIYFENFQIFLRFLFGKSRIMDHAI